MERYNCRILSRIWFQNVSNMRHVLYCYCVKWSWGIIINKFLDNNRILRKGLWHGEPFGLVQLIKFMSWTKVRSTVFLLIEILSRRQLNKKFRSYDRLNKAVNSHKKFRTMLTEPTLESKSFSLTYGSEAPVMSIFLSLRASRTATGK